MPPGYRETYSVEPAGTHAIYTLAWHGDDGRGYEVSFDPFGRELNVVYMRGRIAETAPEARGDFVVTGVLRRGRVGFGSAELRRMGAAGWTVFGEMWPRLLARMRR